MPTGISNTNSVSEGTMDTSWHRQLLLKVANDLSQGQVTSFHHLFKQCSSLKRISRKLLTHNPCSHHRTDPWDTRFTQNETAQEAPSFLRKTEP